MIVYKENIIYPTNFLPELPSSAFGEYHIACVPFHLNVFNVISIVYIQEKATS